MHIAWQPSLDWGGQEMQQQSERWKQAISDVQRDCQTSPPCPGGRAKAQYQRTVMRTIEAAALQTRLMGDRHEVARVLLSLLVGWLPNVPSTS